MSDGNDFSNPRLSAEIYTMFRDYIKQEDTLINQRLTWLLTIHGFLYATCGFTLQKRIEIVQKIASDFRSMGCSHLDACSPLPGAVQNIYFGYAHLRFDIVQLDAFLFLLAIIGSSISFIGMKSIVAAKRASIHIALIFTTQFGTDDTQIDTQIPQFSRTKSLKIPKNRSLQKSFRKGTFCIVNFDGKIVVFPSIVGGGLSLSERGGFFAPEWIPRLLIAGWVAALATGVAYWARYYSFIKHVLM